MTLEETIMDILMNYLPKNGVSKTRDELLTLYTKIVEGEWLELYSKINSYAMHKKETHGENSDYFVTMEELESFFKEYLSNESKK